MCGSVRVCVQQTCVKEGEGDSPVSLICPSSSRRMLKENIVKCENNVSEGVDILLINGPIFYTFLVFFLKFLYP